MGNLVARPGIADYCESSFALEGICEAILNYRTSTPI